MGNNFLENIISEVDDDLSDKASGSKHKSSKQPKDQIPAADKADKSVVALGKKSVSNRGAKKHASESQIDTRVYAKARIQKSIRFRPELIARLNAYVSRLELTGNNPVSFQQAQNEALQMWLDAKKA